MARSMATTARRPSGTGRRRWSGSPVSRRCSGSSACSEALDKNFRAAAGDEITPERDACEIRFPWGEGYRVELPEERLTARFDDDATLELTPDRRTAPARWGPILVAGNRRRRSRWV